MSEYVEKLYDIEGVPAADDMTMGDVLSSVITVTASGDYKRGEILMKQGDTFVKATEAGITNAEELCIMSDSFTLDDGMTARTLGYFFGRMNGKRLYLNGELLTEYEESERESVIGALRKHKIFVR